MLRREAKVELDRAPSGNMTMAASRGPIRHGDDRAWAAGAEHLVVAEGEHLAGAVAADTAADATRRVGV